MLRFLATRNLTLSLKDLFIELGIDIESFNRSSLSYYKIDLNEYHRRNLKEAFENHLMEFKRKLYAWSIEHSRERQFLHNIALYEKNDTYILEKANEAKNSLELGYDKVVEMFIEENFDFENIMPTAIDFEAVRDQNELLVNIENLKGDVELLSLLYFDNKVEEINKSELLREDAQKQDEEVDESIVDGILIKDVELSPIMQSKSSAHRQKSSKAHKHNGDDKKKRRGNRSEKIAFDVLVKKYGNENVIWKSKEDDSVGYDLKYQDNSGHWKYVEVKTYSGNQFYLSRNEKEFADEHKRQYEIFLVGDDVLRIKDVDFSNREEFKLTTKEYIVEYNIGDTETRLEDR